MGLSGRFFSSARAAPKSPATSTSMASETPGIRAVPVRAAARASPRVMLSKPAPRLAWMTAVICFMVSGSRATHLPFQATRGCLRLTIWAKSSSSSLSSPSMRDQSADTEPSRPAWGVAEGSAFAIWRAPRRTLARRRRAPPNSARASGICTRKPASFSWAAPLVRNCQASEGSSFRSSGFCPARAPWSGGKKGTARARPRRSTFRASSTTGSAEASQSLATGMLSPSWVSRPTRISQPSSLRRSASWMASRLGGTGGASSLRLGRIHCCRAPSLHCSSCSPRVRSVTPTVGNSFMGWLRATMMRSSQGRRSRLCPLSRWMRPRRGSSPCRRVPATNRTRKSAPSSRKDRSSCSGLGGMASSSSSSSVSSVPRASPLVKTHMSSSGKA